MYQVLMQRLDPEMKEGTILEWLKKEGDNVHKGEPIARVEGEKVIFEIEAPENGILIKLLVETGTSVSVGKQIAIIAEPGEKIPEFKEIRKELSPKKANETPKATPAARKIAKEHNIVLAEVNGSGPTGEILKRDVLAIVEEMSTKKTETVASPESVELIPLVGMRKTIADRLTSSYRTVPHVAVTMEADMSESLRLHEILEKIEKTKIPLTAFLAKVVAKALKSHPVHNATVEGAQVRILKNINMGIAVALDEGLIVPIIHDADKKSIFEIARLFTDLVKKARERSLSMGELKHGTFTITNLGAFDIDVFTPIINPPQTAILGVGRIAEKPRAVGGQIKVLPVITLTVVFDHRAIDGAQAARFLQEIKKLLEDPYELFVGEI